jgi:hypothetical protein
MSETKIVQEWLRYANDEIAPNESMVATALRNARQVYDFCLAKIGYAV